ncbi:MAG: DUF1624 domain-containing protein [Oscillospiraceae bacterium]|nr:DUF1624 domain-containing protein [Oscillospiraceae bacterium]
MTKSTRLHLLDALRGLTLISMAAYHAMWNLVHLYGIDGAWFTGSIGYAWQQSICWTFILLSGFCFSLSRNHIKRGLLIFSGGVIVSLVTHLVIPAARITFGILTFTGSAVLLMIPLEKLLKKASPLPGLIVSAMLFALLRNVPKGSLGFEGLVLTALPRGLYRNHLTAFLGFPQPAFWSADYFPLLPWLCLFVCGYFLFRVFHDRGWNEKLFARGNFPLLNFLGRHSLMVYLLHQPVIYGLMALLLQ